MNYLKDKKWPQKNQKLYEYSVGWLELRHTEIGWSVIFPFSDIRSSSILMSCWTHSRVGQSKGKLVGFPYCHILNSSISALLYTQLTEKRFSVFWFFSSTNFADPVLGTEEVYMVRILSPFLGCSSLREYTSLQIKDYRQVRNVSG